MADGMYERLAARALHVEELEAEGHGDGQHGAQRREMHAQACRAAFEDGVEEFAWT
jgi:hypothetical protein